MNSSIDLALSRYPERPFDQTTELWWVAKVKPRQEKQLALDFHNSKIEYYLPLYKKVTYRPESNKKRTFIVPLFPGYIFFAQTVPHDIYKTGRIVNLIEVKDQKKIIHELTQIQSVLTNDFEVEPLTESFQKEDFVEVVKGRIKGVKGFVTSIKGKRKLVLSVSGIGSASVEIDMSCVVKAKPEED